MVGRAVSQAVQDAKQLRQKNERMQRAVETYHIEVEKKQAGLKAKSARQVAREHDVPRSTMERLAGGKLSMSAFNAAKQKLSPAKERVLVEYIKESADIGFPLSHKQIQAAAEAIIQSESPKDVSSATGSMEDGKLGKRWVDRLLVRHHDELAGHWSKPLDMIRAKALNPAAVHHWFHDVVRKEIVNAEVSPELTFGMDEVGMPESNHNSERVVGRRGTKRQHKQGGGSKKNQTVIVWICADGSTPRPTIIFEGQNWQKKWRKDNVAKAK
jgi:hypothetical protein